MGNRPDENEDSFWPLKADDSLSSFTAAISDGATQSIFSGAWSKLLVEHFGKAGFSKDHVSFRKEVHALQERWLEKAMEKPLPWYAEHKVLQGAFASLLTIRIIKSSEPFSLRWSSAAIGDSCLFHLRGNKFLCSSPLNCSGGLDANPHLICSNESANREIEREIIPVEGQCQIEDSFFLVTDMVARCIFRMMEVEELPWDPLLKIDSESAFQNWVEAQRLRFGIKHDDATMLRIQIF